MALDPVPGARRLVVTLINRRVGARDRAATPRAPFLSRSLPMSKRMSTPAALAAGALVAVVLTPGSAVAATAKSVLLGRSNKATTTTVLANSKGTPLALTAKKGSAPLKVSSSTKVAGLNADQLDGLSSSSFARSTGRTGIVLSPTAGVAAKCPAGTILTGGGGLDEMGLLYSGPELSAAGDFVPNTWLAFGVSGSGFSFATCYSPSGAAIPGAITSARAKALVARQAERVAALKARHATR
jgi:hypothetical protein